MTTDELRDLLAKVTPGPWSVVPYGDGDSLAVHDAGDFEGIEANARLIALAQGETNNAG